MPSSPTVCALLALVVALGSSVVRVVEGADHPSCLVDEGGACTSTPQCVQGLMCDTQITKTCVYPWEQQDGALCTSAGQCKSGACAGGKCGMPVKEGEKCTQGQCEVGFVCNKEKCIKMFSLKAGDAADTSNACEFGLTVSAGSCAVPNSQPVCDGGYLSQWCGSSCFRMGDPDCLSDYGKVLGVGKDAELARAKAGYSVAKCVVGTDGFSKASAPAWPQWTESAIAFFVLWMFFLLVLIVLVILLVKKKSGGGGGGGKSSLGEPLNY